MSSGPIYLTVVATLRTPSNARINSKMTLASKFNFVKYFVLFAATRDSYAEFSYIMSKQWFLDPSTTSTSIIAEFIPLDITSTISGTRLAHDDPFLNGIIYMVNFQQAVACLVMSLLGAAFILDMIFVSSKRYLRNETSWLRDPLEVLDPTKRNSVEKQVFRYGKDLARVWSMTSILIIMIAVEWDIFHHWRRASQDYTVESPEFNNMAGAVSVAP